MPIKILIFALAILFDILWIAFWTDFFKRRGYDAFIDFLIGGLIFIVLFSIFLFCDLGV